MGSVDIGVGHDDDAVVAQIVGVAVLAHAAAHGEREVRDFSVGADLVHGGGGDVEDLAADRQDRLGLAVARLLGRTAGRIAFDDEQLGLALALASAVGEFAGKAEFARRRGRLALDLTLGLAGEAFIHPLHDMAEQGLASFHVVGEEMVEVIAHRIFDHARGLGAGQAVLGLALELRIADEDGEHRLTAGDNVFRRYVFGLLGADQIGEGADALDQRGAQALFVGAAIGSGDSVAIVAVGAIRPQRPGHRPFDAALLLSGEIL